MTLFLVGVIEMIIATNWTKSVAKANVALTGVITTINIFIWYYVLRQVVDNLDKWYAIIPYASGCALGAMVAAVEWQTVMKKFRRFRAEQRKTARSPKRQKTMPALPAVKLVRPGLSEGGTETGV